MKKDDCSFHIGEKQDMFCEEFRCWKQICMKCAQESHIGHKVVEYSELIAEAKKQKEKLIRAKKGDVMSLKKILETLDVLQIQLATAQKKRIIEAKQAEINVAARIQKLTKESETRSMELNEELLKIKTTLKESFEAQSEEITKIPDLADAVIAHGTLEDLQTFFEMCENGVESNIEIVSYKKSIDWLRKKIEEYITINPLSLLFAFDKSIYEAADLTEIQMSEITVKTQCNKNIIDKESPKIQSATGFAQKKHARTNSTIIGTAKPIIKEGNDSSKYLQKTTRNNRCSLDNITTLANKANVQVGNPQKYRTIFNKSPVTALNSNKEKPTVKSGARNTRMTYHKKNPSDTPHNKNELVKIKPLKSKCFNSSKKEVVKEKTKINTSTVPSSTRNNKKSSIRSPTEASRRKGGNLKVIKMTIGSLRHQLEFLSKAMKATLNATLNIPSTMNSAIQYITKPKFYVQPINKFSISLSNTIKLMNTNTLPLDKLIAFMKAIEEVQVNFRELA